MPPGWHITTGPGAILFDPATTTDGRFRLESEIILFPNPSPAGVGLLVGGTNLEGSALSYVSFLIRRDGSAAVLRVRGREIEPLVPWTVHQAIRPHEGQGTVSNVLRVEAEGADVVFSVNGERVARIPRETARVEGRVGFRVGPELNLHITTLDLTYPLAPAAMQ